MTGRLDTRHPIFWVHRLGAVVLALILWAFAALGFASGTGFLTTHGAWRQAIRHGWRGSS